MKALLITILVVSLLRVIARVVEIASGKYPRMLSLEPIHDLLSLLYNAALAVWVAILLRSLW